jgi:hypothetical protein
MRQRINIRERLPVWRLRLILGGMLMFFSEIVMWQNPLARSPLEWPVLLVLYVAQAAILLDLVVRFQANEIASLFLVCGMYGLVNSAVISHIALEQVPVSLLVRGMALQTGAAFYGLMFFISVMRGKQPDGIQALFAVAIGVLWGIWLHWYPLQRGWGLVSLETAQLTIAIALVLLGAGIFVVAPRFKVYREEHILLLWWEMVLVGVPLFIALLVAMLQNLVPFIPLLLVFAIGAFIAWTLFYQREGYDPSIFAQMTFASPNFITFIALSILFVAAGTLAYSLVTDADSPVGVGTYWLIVVLGSAWLPGASILLFLREYRARQKARKPSKKMS